jgi:serine/threonine protein kinase
MSPEQATGGKVDARSDVFGFGAVLYEMVTGRRAFAGKTVSETLTAVVRDQPRAPRELLPEIPEALERLILRCLRKEPGSFSYGGREVELRDQEDSKRPSHERLSPSARPAGGRAVECWRRPAVCSCSGRKSISPPRSWSVDRQPGAEMFPTSPGQQPHRLRLERRRRNWDIS